MKTTGGEFLGRSRYTVISLGLTCIGPQGFRRIFPARSRLRTSSCPLSTTLPPVWPPRAQDVDDGDENDPYHGR
jgi:hypothetical protein